MLEGEGDELDLEDWDEDETWGEGVEGVNVGLVVGTISWIEGPDPGVVVGEVLGTGVGWGAGLELVVGLGLTVPGLEDPPVMVNTGEMLPELPITTFNVS